MRVMGIDLGTHKLAYALFEGDQLHVMAHVSQETTRVRQLWEVSAFARNIVAMHQPDWIWVEDVLVGNNRKYSIQLAEVKGAVLAAMAPSGVDIRMVNVSTWKAGVVGNGHASKDQVKDYIDVTHGAYAPLCGDDQDLYDATCIGLYGLSILERASTLRL